MSFEEPQKQGHPHRRRRKLRWGRLVCFLLVLAALLTSLFWGLLWCYNNLIAPPKARVIGANQEIVTDARLNERINVLLMGLDEGDSEAAKDEPKRTDTMMLLSFEPKNDEVSIVSLPRDTLVKIPGYKGDEKINAAYPYGGELLAQQTVANLLRVPIHYYVVVDWRAFEEAVDLIGGVDLYVDTNMYYEDPYANLVIDIKQGYRHLNGLQAGHYVRFRNDELGDIGRVQRQQKFMRAFAAQVFNVDTVTKIPDILTAVSKHVQTDMDKLTMIKAANSFKLFGDSNLKACMLYGEFYDSPDGISYWRTNPELVAKTLDEVGIPYLKRSGSSGVKTGDRVRVIDNNNDIVDKTYKTNDNKN